jgi:DNA helicase IV
LQLVTPLDRQHEGYDSESLKTLDGKVIEEGTPDELAESCDLEDLALMLFLKARSGGLETEHLAHLVLDETEDFSLFELEVLGKQLGRHGTCTLAGDELQQTEAGFSGWDGVLRAVGAKDASICRLQVSYRCPRPVVELAQHILGQHTDESRAGAHREGVPVGFQHFPDEAQTALFLSAALRDLVEREPNASVGVIASSTDKAERLAEELGALHQVRLVTDGEFTFEPGIDVCDVDSTKGLEFDYVIVPDATAQAYPANDESRRRLHVAVTRASHQLWVVSSGSRSPLLPNRNDA